MPKESGPKGNEMNRREFFKTTAAGGAVTLEKIAGGQEKQLLDNHIEEYVYESVTNTKIKYPEISEPITPEIEDIIKAILYYESIKSGPEENLMVAKQDVWNKLKKVDPELNEFSNDSFYRTLAVKLPSYLANYGIFAESNLWFLKDEKSGNFLRTELETRFMKIANIQNYEVKQSGIIIPVDVICLKGSLEIDGKAVTDESKASHAANAYGNIFMFESGIEQEFTGHINNIKSFENQINKSGKKEAIDIAQKNLEQFNEIDVATLLAMMKIFGRMERRPILEEFKAEVLSHESAHLIDMAQGIYSQIMIFKKTSSFIEQVTTNQNIRANQEINPLIAQIKHAPNRKFTIFRLLANSRDTPEAVSPIRKYYAWVVGHMVGIISKNPAQYGITILSAEKTTVSQFNQILSQLDALLDHPDLIDSLCDELIAFHNQNLTENIASETDAEIQGPFTINEASDLSSLYKIGIPAAVVGGGALALEALRRRKNRIAKEKSSMAQITKTKRIEEEIRQKKKTRKSKG